MSAILDQDTNSPLARSFAGPRANEVASFTPVVVTAAEQKLAEEQFAFRFTETMHGRARSLLASDVYHEPSARLVDAAFAAGKITHEEHQGLTIILSGQAWHQVSKAKIPYEEQLIERALDDGLIGKIFGKKIRFNSRGPGPNGTVDSKEGLIIRALLENGREIPEFSATDKNRSYAVGASSFIGDKYNIKARGIQGDFVWGEVGGLPIQPCEKDEVDLVTVFGNTPYNAASFIRDGRQVSYQESVTNFYAKINAQHGVGHYLLVTVDTDQNPKTQLKNYMITPAHEQLILAPTALARLNGIITRPYPIFAHMRMAINYDHAEDTVELMIEPKDDHVMPTLNEEFRFRAGQDQRVIMASHKWPTHVHTNILGRAGYDTLHIAKNDHNPYVLILAQSVRAPGNNLF